MIVNDPVELLNKMYTNVCPYLVYSFKLTSLDNIIFLVFMCLCFKNISYWLFMSRAFTLSVSNSMAQNVRSIAYLNMLKTTFTT